MQHLTISAQDALMHHLAQGRMREDGVHEVCFNQFSSFADCVALNKLSHLCANHMRAKQLASFAIEDGFDEALPYAPAMVAQ